MAKILYVKGMNISESEGEESGNDIWDDRKLNNAYDKALKIANAEVARRVAMSTNTKQGNHHGGTEEKSKPKKEKPQKSYIQWKVSMPCRAVYDGDGIEYEGLVERILNDKECVVRFIGYENSEIVPLGTLKPTLGKEERRAQIENAMFDKKEELSNDINHGDVYKMDTCNDRIPTPESTEKSFSKKKKKSKQKRQTQIPMMNGFDMPDMSIPMPNPNLFRNLGSMDMPMPPPPLMFPTSSGRVDSEEQAVSSMLISWYMSGYYTGLYHGIRRSKESRKD